MVDAARLADELRTEQDTAMALERDKKLLECQASKYYSNAVYRCTMSDIFSGEGCLLKAGRNRTECPEGGKEGDGKDGDPHP